MYRRPLRGRAYWAIALPYNALVKQCSLWSIGISPLMGQMVTIYALFSLF
jgi:hypothetical protein